MSTTPRCPWSSNPENQSVIEFYRHLYTANLLLGRLPFELHQRLRDRVGDMFARVCEEIVKHWNPTTLDDVRNYDMSLRSYALVHLLNDHFKSACKGVQVGQFDDWKDFLWDDERHADAVLSDTSVRTIEDVVAWFLRNDARLWPKATQTER